MNKPLSFILGLAVGVLIGGGPTILSFLRWGVTKSEPRPAAPFANAALAQLPFRGEWLVSSGGENRTDNQHYGIPPQDLALDIRKIVPGTRQTIVGDPQRNESYGCWSQPIYSPVAGLVAVSVDGIPDNIPGELNREMKLGNFTIITADEGFSVVLCHFRNGSVAAKRGSRVAAGDLIGLCGNSGQSTEPHLHIHAQSQAELGKSVALRPVFRELSVGGIPRTEYSPKKGDIISDRDAPPKQDR